MLIQYATTTLEIFARGGGGGSSGGGGGGGEGILIIGAGPPYYITNKLVKKMGTRWAVIIGAPASLVWGTLLAIVLRNGLGALLFFAAIGGFFGGYFGLHRRILNRAKKARKHIDAAATLDPAWHPDVLTKRVEEIFYQYQNDWCNFDTNKIRTYTTDHFAYHNWLMMSAIHQLSRRNAMSEIKLESVILVEAHDSLENHHDTFTAHITAKAKDQLIDTRKNEIIYTDDSTFSEYWTFSRHEDKGWLLARIEQETAGFTPKSAQVSAFAATNNLYFSLDWGWLLLPKLGNIFSKADFKKSDINNHCIGMLGEELVQLYGYVPARSNNNNQTVETVVAQIAVPRKDYGRIVVEHKTRFSLFNRTPKGLNKLKVESQEINKRFNIYADNIEQVTTFELLQPVYMENIIATPGKINIEVYENTIFIYSKDKKVRYEDLFTLLIKAHKELVR